MEPETKLIRNAYEEAEISSFPVNRVSTVATFNLRFASTVVEVTFVRMENPGNATKQCFNFNS